MAHRLTEDQLVAVPVHELGHHASRAPKSGLVTAWFTAPWRLATRVLLRVVGGLAGRQPRPLLPVVVCVGVVLTVAQALAQRNWAVAGVLGGGASLAALCPLSDAALARTEEMSADQYAADHGLALPLANALRVLHDGHQAAGGGSRLLASHPSVDRRIDTLLALSDRAPARTNSARPGTERGGAVQQPIQQRGAHGGEQTLDRGGRGVTGERFAVGTTSAEVPHTVTRPRRAPLGTV
jgi:STE24 endopeptidase